MLTKLDVSFKLIGATVYFQVVLQFVYRSDSRFIDQGTIILETDSWLQPWHRLKSQSQSFFADPENDIYGRIAPSKKKKGGGGGNQRKKYLANVVWLQFLDALDAYYGPFLVGISIVFSAGFLASYIIKLVVVLANNQNGSSPR